jgi:hypothetical protein
MSKAKLKFSLSLHDGDEQVAGGGGTIDFDSLQPAEEAFNQLQKIINQMGVTPGGKWYEAEIR